MPKLTLAYGTVKASSKPGHDTEQTCGAYLRIIPPKNAPPNIVSQSISEKI